MSVTKTVSITKIEWGHRFDYDHHYYEVLGGNLHDAIEYIRVELEENGLNNWISY